MSINKVILVGNVGKDPEVRYFDNGGCVANFSLATSERGYTAANGTQVPDRTEWHSIVMWKKLAETAEKYVRKGAKLYLEGKIHSRSYDDATGAKRYVTEIWCDTMEMLDRKEAANTATVLTANEGTTSIVSVPTVSQPPVVGSTHPTASDPPIGNATDDLPF